MGATNLRPGQKITTIERHIIDSQASFPDAGGTLTSLLYDIAIAGKLIGNIQQGLTRQDLLAVNVHQTQIGFRCTGHVSLRNVFTDLLTECQNLFLFNQLLRCSFYHPGPNGPAPGWPHKGGMPLGNDISILTPPVPALDHGPEIKVAAANPTQGQTEQHGSNTKGIP